MPSSLKQPVPAGVLEIIIHVCPFLLFVRYPVLTTIGARRLWSHPTVTALILPGTYYLIFFVHDIRKIIL